MKKIFTLFILISFFGTKVIGQTIIDPAGDGGFENGTTFSANGWTEVQAGGAAANKWYVGTTYKTVGTRGAYVSNDGGTTNAYTVTVARTQYIYRDVIFPAGATNIVLSFKWRCVGENATGADNYDFLRVFLAPTSTTFTAGTLSTATSIGTGKYNLQSTTQTATISLASATYAGTSQRLAFCWTNDASAGAQPPAGIDEISLTYTPSSTPYLSATVPTAFGGVCINTTAGPNSFTLTGGNLTSNVTVGALSGYTYSTTSAGAYTNTLTLTPVSGSINQAVYVKFSPTLAQSYSSNILISGGGATAINVAASGSGINTAPTVTSGAATGVTATSSTVGGTITATGCSAVTGYGIEYSTTSGFANGAGTVVASTNLSGGAFSSNLTGLTPNTTYYYHAYATNAGGTAYGAEANFITSCSAITTFPYTETFDATSTTLGCYRVSQGSGASYSWNVTTADATHGVAGPQASTRFAFLDVYDAQTTYNPYYLITPSFTLNATTKQLSYYYFLGNAGYKGTTGATGSDPYPLTVQISTDGGTSWTDLYNHSSTNSTFATSTSVSFWTLNTISLAAYVNNTIQIRFKSNSNYGTGICNQGIDQITIANTCTPPTSQAVIGAYTNNNGSSVTVNWTRGNGNNVLVVARLSSATAVDPLSGTAYTANAAFGSGSTTGSGNYVVYSGTGTSVNVTGLTGSTGYTFTVYEYITTGPCYLTPGSSSAVTTAVFYCTTGLYTTGCTFSTPDEINDFTISNLSHLASGCSGGTAGYGDFTSTQPVINVIQGITYTYTITSPATSEYVGVWIDLNDNKSFTDAGEFIGGTATASSGSTITGTVLIPAGAAIGNHRLRVRLVYNTVQSLGTACSSYTYGEAQDYTVNVTAPLPTITSTSPISSCVGQSVTITGTNFTSPITSVSFGGVAASTFAYVNATTITATVPAGAVSGAITVTEASGSGTSSILYGVYTIPAPTASNNGPICSGTVATLIASGLAPGGTVGNFTATTGKSASITSISNSFTMEFWVKPGGTITLNAQSTSATTGLTGQQYAVAPTQSATNGGVGVSVGTNGISVYEHGNGYLSPLLTYTFPTAISNWINVAVVYTSRTPSLYINGSKVATGLTSVFGTNSYPSIGSDGTGGYNYGPFTGSLDNYRLWNGSLTQAEIVSVMFNQNGTTSKTKLAQYTFNANTVTDSTGTNPTWNIPSSFVTPNYFTYTWTGTNAPAASTSETQTTTGPLTANQSYTVTASIGGSCTSASSAATTVVVTPPSSVASVTGTTPLCIGGTATYTANSVVLSGGTGAWSSSNMAVATINAATGLVTAVAAGTTNIIYTITGGCGGTASAQQSLTVSPNVTAGTVSGTSPLCIAATATYSSTGTAGGTWSSTNTAVATVDVASGLVTAVAAGTTNITYTVSSGCGSPASAFKTLTVSPTVTSGTVSGTTPLCIGASATYTSNGTAGGTWTSNNTAVATVNASTGVVTAIAAGNANIRYTITSGCGSPVTSAKALTVSPNVTAGTVSGNSPLCIGTTTTYTTTGTTGGTWSSTNTGVATVNVTSGLVTAVGAGTTDITYTVNGGCGSPTSAFKTLTVSPNVTAGAIGGTSPLCTGSTATYTTTSTSSGTWSSTNTGVATVNATSGLVTAVGAGTTNITYTVSSGCGSPVSSFKTLTVTATPSATISYAGDPYCGGTGTATVTRTGTAGGTYTSPDGLIINAATGAVDLSANSAGTYTVYYTVAASGGCSSYQATTTITINDNQWTGAINTDWGTAGNWSCGVPTSTSNVIIPETGTNPIISSGGNFSAHDITISTSSDPNNPVSLTINIGGILRIFGNTDNADVIANSGRIVLMGTTPQTFPGFEPNGRITVMNEFEVNNSSAAGITLDSSFSINGVLIPTAGTIDLGDNDITLYSDVANTARVAQIPTVATAFAPFNYSGTGRFKVEQYVHNRDTYMGEAAGRSYRLMTGPVASAQTIKDAWQDGLNYGDPYIPGEGTLITGPGGATNGFDGTTTSPSLKYYNSNLQLVSVPNTNIATVSNSSYTLGGTPANQGYFMFVRGDRNPANLSTANSNSTTLTVTGKLQTGNMTYTAPPLANAAGSFVLLANPYASPVDFDKVYMNTNTSNIRRLFYAWNPEKNNYTGGYATISYNSTSGAYDNSDNLDVTNHQTQDIQSNQSVFVTTAASNTVPTIGFAENEKSSVYRYVFRPSSANIGSLRTNLYIANTANTYADGALVQYNAAYSDNLDDLDAAKAANPGENIAIIRSGENLSIERRNIISANDTIYFNLWNTRQISYYFSFVASDFDRGTTGYLVDNYLKTSTPLNLEGSTTVNFTVTTDAGSAAADRFMIVFRPSATLPVTFTRVKAYQQGSNINVEWSIENEVNTRQYEVERSTDGRIFTNSTTVTVTKNNGTTAAYTWPDASPANGANYYRIKSVSKSGEIRYSSIVKVTIGNGRPLIAVYPNPASGGTINLQLINQPAGRYGIRLLDKIGQVILVKQTEHTEGSSTETLQVSKAMAHGNYQLEITKPDGGKTNISVLY